MKKDFTETGYIEDVISRIALVHPEISIKLINTGKTTISTNGNGDIKSVVYSIYGKDIAEEIIPVEYEYENIKVKGVIGKPAIARSNRSNQIFFVNDRYIKDKTLTAAAEQAYKGMIPIGKFAFLILNLEMDPSKVDVNVHPAKLEVRFSEESTVFQAVFHTIKNTLLSADLISDRDKNKEIKEASKDAFKIDYNNLNKGGLFGKPGVSNSTVQETMKFDNSKLSDMMQMPNTSNIDNKQSLNTKENKATMDVFERLKRLQQQLKNDLVANPSIQLTDNYKMMENKYNEIVTATDELNKNSDKQDTKNETSDNINVTNKQESQTNEQETHDFVDNQSNIQENQSFAENQEFENTNNENQNFDENKNENETIEEIKHENERIEENKEANSNIENSENNDTEIKQENSTNTNNAPEENIESEQNQKVEEVKDKILSFEAMYKELFGKEPYGGRLKVEDTTKKDNQYKITEDDLDENVSVFEGLSEYQKPTYKFIGIAFKTYIILEMNQELYIMDQHAAHERILYERVKKNFFNDVDKECQMLLLPDVITLTNKEMNIARDNFKLFERAGFMVEEFGENTIKVSGVPEICIDLDTKELFMETLDEINTVARTAKQEKEEKFIATVACKAAVKANMALTEEEVKSLMDELLKLPNPFSCPHGRPTVIKMSKYDIERKFARK